LAISGQVSFFLLWGSKGDIGVLLGPAPTGTGTIAFDPTFGSFTLLNQFHIRGTSFFGESVQTL